MLFFLVPALTYGLNQEKCTHIYDQIASEWKRHGEFLEQYQQLTSNEEEKALQLITRSVACCKRAIAHCDTILDEIASRSKSERKAPWRIQLKAVCEQDKNNLNAEIDVLESLIQQIKSHLAVNKANIAEEKATLARTKEQACQRRLSNVDEIVAVLHEGAKLYEEAATIAREALALLLPYPSQTQNQSVLKQLIETYQGLGEKYKKEAIDWPASVVAQKSTLKDQVAVLNKDSKLLIEKGCNHKWW